MNTRSDSFKHQGQRKRLIQGLKLKNIHSQGVLDAMANVPRHLFMAKDFEDKAYEDIALPIEDGQTISQPYTVAMQTQALNIVAGDKVLEIGTGSGYQAAVLAQMGAEVYSIERIPRLHTQASKILNKLYPNIHLYLSDGTLGLPEMAPFDKIIVTAAAPKMQDLLIAQLKPGGLAIIPIGDLKIQKMVLIERSVDNKIRQKELGEFRFVPLIGQDGWKKE